MVASLLLTNRQVGVLRQQEEIADRIEQGADELNYLAGDYLMCGESQQRVRWESSFASFSEDLARLMPLNLEQQTMISHIMADQKRLQAIFKDVALHPGRVHPNLRQHTWLCIYSGFLEPDGSSEPEHRFRSRFARPAIT